MPKTSTKRNPRPPLFGWRGGVWVVVALGAFVVARATSAIAASPSSYRIIANPSCSLSTVDRTFVSQAFLKKIRRWPDGEAIQPVDLDPRSSVRRSWSEEVLSRSVEAVRMYWQQMIFSGRELPPPELRSDEEVVGYVLRRPGAIGYVSASTDVHGAKVLTLR